MRCDDPTTTVGDPSGEKRTTTTSPSPQISIKSRPASWMPIFPCAASTMVRWRRPSCLAPHLATPRRRRENGLGFGQGQRDLGLECIAQIARRNERQVMRPPARGGAADHIARRGVELR